MQNFLFGLIALLLASIVTTGGISLAQNPDKIPDVKSEVVSVAEKVTREVTNAASIVTGQGPTENKVTQTTQTSSNEDDEDDDDDRPSGTTASTPVAPKPQTSTQTNPQTPAASGTTFTMAQVATHNSAANCYTVINGSVYNLTPFINQHPGGVGNISSICGKDGTAAFAGQHSGARKPESELASLKIGTLN